MHYSAFQTSPLSSPFFGKSLSISTTKCPTSSRTTVQMLTKIPNGGVTAPKGFKATGLTAGFKPSGLPDLAVVISEDNSPLNAAALFTKNIVRAAPVEISESNWKQAGGKITAVLLNSGQANAGTGHLGHQDGVDTTIAAAHALGCHPSNVFVCSTGVIGHRFDIDKMKNAIPQLISTAQPSIEGGTAAAKAIMTTDLKMKQVAFQEEIGGKLVTVGGMCKGSGMIHPDMATMLAVLTCDAEVEPSLWQTMLKRAVDQSFNVITVDGDTSTNDVVCALSSAAAGISVNDPNSPNAAALQSLLTKACVYLAKSIARDGEGATVLVEIHVSGAENDEDARNIARTIASSSLTKAAIFGRDPNWGRIAAAAGRSRANFDVGEMKISIGDHVLMEKGTPIDFDAAAASNYMKLKSEASEDKYLTDDDTVVISVDLGSGSGVGIAWGCDLSYKYVEINAEYTT